MSIPEVLCVVILCIGLSHAVVNVTVPECSTNEAKWTLTGGTVGGITYVETSTNVTCVWAITSAVTQDFVTHFTLCGATPALSLGNTEQVFIIVVQGSPIFNAATDTRWKVKCEFNTGTSNVEAIFIGQSNNPSGNPENNITTTSNPVPVIALYTNENGTETLVNTTSVLSLGENVTARITLNQNTTDYSLHVVAGEISSQTVGQISAISLSTVVLLNSTTYCAIHEVFLSFEYKQTPEGYHYAETQFEAFLPSLPSINLQTTNIQLKLAFRVTLCLVGIGCSQVACPDRPAVVRRRREADTTDGENNDQTYNLQDGFQIQLESNANSLADEDGANVSRGTNESENTVCLARSQFWGLIMGLIGFLALACLASCCLCFFFLRCRRRNRDQRVSKKLSETSSVSTMSTLSMDRKLTAEPENKQAFVLPRFFPDFNTRGPK